MEMSLLANDISMTYLSKRVHNSKFAAVHCPLLCLTHNVCCFSMALSNLRLSHVLSTALQCDFKSCLHRFIILSFLFPSYFFCLYGAVKVKCETETINCWLEPCRDQLLLRVSIQKPAIREQSTEQSLRTVRACVRECVFVCNETLT